MEMRYEYTYRWDQAFPPVSWLGMLSEQACMTDAKERASVDGIGVNVFRRPACEPGKGLMPWQLYTVCYPNGGECKYDEKAERQRLAELWFEETVAHVRNCLNEDCDWYDNFSQFLCEHEAVGLALGITFAPRDKEVDKP